ncbi:4Fe-4S dicluster domain-containing protein [Adlercreutzia sp. ZJ473]|uniref:4Fe-4S dicluster domain-containing protein n=1 Tax=Adlercreutzia sp. ZJ473 TaxID=2722822 RepID=UPI001554C027|nr:4Fe-4S dicluster domain-containing protein [Adlercreutzia sp. ZJ473]
MACKIKTNSFLGSHYTDTKTNQSLDFPNPNTYFIPTLCNHCERPSCAEVCPNEVLYKREDGIVAVGDTSICGQCDSKACVKACPYSAIYLDPLSGEIGKCDMCADLIDKGETPACVGVCYLNSIYFGDFDDPNSVVSQILVSWDGYVHRLEAGSNGGVAVYYMLSKKKWENMDHLVSPSWKNEDFIIEEAVC